METERFTDRHRQDRASDGAHADALRIVNSALAGAINAMIDSKFPSDVKGSTSLMQSFRNQDNDGKERFDAPRMVGLYGFVDAMHLATRQHVSQLHMRYKNQALESLALVPWENALVPELNSIAHQCVSLETLLTGLHEDSVHKLRRAATDMKQIAQEAAANPTRAGKAKLYWATGEIMAQITHIKQSGVLDESRSKGISDIRKSIHVSTGRLLPDKERDMLGEAQVDITLLDNKGEPIMLSNGKPATAPVLGGVLEEVSIIDYIVGAIGSRGALNPKYSSVYQDTTSYLIGNASNTLSKLHFAKKSLRNALVKAHPECDVKEIEHALSQGGINFTPLMMQHMHRFTERYLPEITFYQYATNLSAGKDSAEFENYFKGLVAMLGVTPPKQEDLLPRTRHEHMLLLHAMDEQRISVSRLFGSKESRSLEQAIERAKLHLVPQEDEIDANGGKDMPYFLTASPAQLMPDEEMKDVLKDVLEAASAYNASRKEPVASISTITSLIARGMDGHSAAMETEQKHAGAALG